MSRVFELALAGVLHDIGKLGQRAFKENEGLSEHVLSLENSICPRKVDSTYYTHRHVLYTAEFMDWLQKSKSVPDKLNLSEVFKLASDYHNPESDSPDTLFIQDADRLAAGIERTDMQKIDQRSWNEFRKIRLAPITASICRSFKGIPQSESLGYHLLQ